MRQGFKSLADVRFHAKLTPMGNVVPSCVLHSNENRYIVEIFYAECSREFPDRVVCIGWIKI